MPTEMSAVQKQSGQPSLRVGPKENARQELAVVGVLESLSGLLEVLADLVTKLDNLMDLMAPLGKQVFKAGAAMALPIVLKLSDQVLNAGALVVPQIMANGDEALAQLTHDIGVDGDLRHD
jgi:hypothetical protein